MPKKQNASKFGKIFLIFCLFLSATLGMQAGTQYLAWSFAYHPSLGFNIAHIYPFWDEYLWYQHWQETYQALFNEAVWISVACCTGFTVIVVLLQYYCFSYKAKSVDDLHGSAHWATKKDIINANLLPKETSFFQKFSKTSAPPSAPTVYVGAWKDPKTKKIHYLKHSGPEHILAYAPTRSGKGVGLVLPTLLSWSKSVVVWDIKGELAALTSGWRKKYAANNIFIFKPMVRGMSKWNPLQEIRIGSEEFETNDIQQFANVFANPDGEKTDHWMKAAINGVIGLVAYEIYRAKADGVRPNLLSITTRLSDPSALPEPTTDKEKAEPEKMVWYQILKDTDPKTGYVEQDIANLARMNAKDFIDTPDKEYGSKMSTLKACFDLFKNKIVAENVSECDFMINDLMNAKNPSTLYFVVESTYHDVAKPIIKVFFNMMIQKLCLEQQFKNGRAVANYKHRLLCLFDEFTSLGKMPAVLKSFPFAAGYGIKYMAICQATSQLVHVYGKGEADDLMSNCNIKITYASNDTGTAEEVSKMAGTATVVKESISESLSKGGKISSINKSYQETQRPLLTADEAMRLKSPIKKGEEIIESGDMLIFPYGFPAIFGTQILYFKDANLFKRACIPAIKTLDVMIHANNENQNLENLKKNLKERPKKETFSCDVVLTKN